MTSYFHDPDTGVWMSSAKRSIAYSDGGEVEANLLETLKQAEDVRSDSQQLRKAIKDWPTEYHLSSDRHNLLLPFTIMASDRVLELGCGCGAMTRYLGESGASVVGIEGSQRRAEIAAERCRDLPNVKVFSENIIEFKSNEVFDYVTLIGVLEYAQCFIDSKDPVGACIEHAKSFLKESGSLVIAIENQLGLKYFNGCMEDHKKIPFYGINGLYDRKDPITFGRLVLTEKLRKHGFPVQEFFYPFPDYKLPGVILSTAAMHEDRLNVADLLIHRTGRDYPETYRRVFAEEMAWKVVNENGLLPDLANSFLVFARPAGASQEPTKWLAKMYNRGRRRLGYQIESTLERDVAGNLVVRKRKLHPEVGMDKNWARHNEKDSNYIEGSLLIAKIHKAMAGEVGIEELACSFAPWVELLVAAATRNEDAKLVLPGDFTDCIPANLVEGDDGKLHYFDSEWDCEMPIALTWVLIRGIYDSLTGCVENRKLGDITFREIVKRIAKRSGVELVDSDFLEADSDEARLSSQCFDENCQKSVLAEIIDRPLSTIKRHLLPSSGNVFDLEDAENEIRRMKSTVSWQITKPLRLIANLPRLMKNVVNSR